MQYQLERKSNLTSRSITLNVTKEETSPRLSNLEDDSLRYKTFFLRKYLAASLQRCFPSRTFRESYSCEK